MRSKLQSLWPILGALAAVYLGVSLFGVVRRNYELKKEITGLQKQVSDLQEEKEQLSYQIEYFKTESFKEKAARAKLGLMMPGEGEIILPRREQVQPAQEQQAKQKAEKSKPNWQQWWEFLFG